MAIANVIEFGGVSSDAYDVVIEGPGEYTAPNRAYESISVPGRNGALILDKGYYENIDAEFNAVIQAKTQLEFERKVRDFKNAIVSQKGYQRLTEAYHPESYRMAVYKSGFDDEPKFIGKAAVFTLVFECKPQRYLMSGETPMEITSGENILNPTLFDASPLLLVEGDGTISFNGYEITLTNEEYGALELASAGSVNRNNIFQHFDDYASMIATGDTITQNGGFTFSSRIKIASNATITGVSASRTQANIPEYTYHFTRDMESNIARIYFEYSGNGTMIFGTDHSQYTDNIKVTVSYTLDGDDTVHSTIINYTISVGKFATYASCRFYVTENHTVQTGYASIGEPNITYGSLTCVSTASILGHPTYIDCDLGEAYKYELDDEDIPILDTMSSLNRYIDLGSDLPVLKPGTNVVNFDDTITSLKIVPNWWKV